MRRLVALVPCLVACAGGPLPARVQVARATAATPERARDAELSQAAARLSPPFQSAAESVRRLDASETNTQRIASATVGTDGTAPGALADARREPYTRD